MPEIVQVKCENCHGRPGDRNCLECGGSGEYSAFAGAVEVTPATPVAPPTAKPDSRPIVEQLFVARPGSDDDVEVPVFCCVCGGPTTCSKTLINFVKLFNRREIAKAEESFDTPYRYQANLIATRELVICDRRECLLKKQAERRAASEEYFRLLDVYNAQMKRGELSSDGETFMRRNHFGDSVDAYYKAPAVEKKRAKKIEAAQAEPPKTARDRSAAERPLELDIEEDKQGGLHGT